MSQGGLSGAEMLRLLCCKFVQYSNPSPPTPTASQLTLSERGTREGFCFPGRHLLSSSHVPGRTASIVEHQGEWPPFQELTQEIGSRKGLPTAQGLC